MRATIVGEHHAVDMHRMAEQMPGDIASQQFLVGQRVRLSEEARGAHWPDVGHWIAEARYDPGYGQVLYSVSDSWPPADHTDIQEGFYASDLTLWPD